MKIDRYLLLGVAYLTFPLWVVAIFVALFVAYVRIFDPFCDTLIEKKITDLSGFNFEISTTYCTTIGTFSYTDIFASRVGEKRKTLLFEYDQLSWIDLPTISVPENDRIVIAAPLVGEIAARRYRWRSVRIDYEIGKIISPVAERRLDDEK